MDCEKAQILMIPHITDGLEPGEGHYRQVETHISSCQSCAEQYQIRRQTVELIRRNKAVFVEVLMTPEEKKAAEQEEIERSWRRIETRLDELEVQKRQGKQAKFRGILVRVSAVAACLFVSVLTWMAFSIHSKSKVAVKPAHRQVALAPKPSLKIELVSKSGSGLIPANQQITSRDELKTLVINGRHRMVINTNTSLSIEPLVKNGNIGCLIELVSGQIYTNVQHDGNPFVVDTAYGEAVITGTTFDIKATDTGTTLVVREGTVQFKSENGVVKVAAGQTSEIVGESAPSRPVLCDAAELTAWATGYKAKPELAEDESRSDIVEFLTLWPNEKEPSALEKVDYNYWVKKKRSWFRLQFPQIFQLQHALDEEGIEVEYPELLVKSGDLWQFVYTKDRPDRFSVLSFDSLLKTASGYGFDEQWLVENVTAAGYALRKPVLLKNGPAVLNAFERWNSSFINAQNSSDWVDYDDQYSLFHASVYLTETRSLLWFAIRDGQYDLTDKERAEVLALLHKQVDTASICRENTLHQPNKKEQLCDPVTRKEDKWYNWAGVIAKNIQAIMDVEGKITEYEIGK